MQSAKVFSNHHHSSFAVVLPVHPLLLRPGVFNLAHPVQLFAGVIEAQVGVRVHRHTYIRMPHQVLQRLRVHALARHVGAIGVPTHVRGDIRKLNLVDGIVLPPDNNARRNTVPMITQTKVMTFSPLRIVVPLIVCGNTFQHYKLKRIPEKTIKHFSVRYEEIPCVQQFQIVLCLRIC